MNDCPFENKELRYNPPNAVSAMCVQLYDDLKLVNAAANCGELRTAKKQMLMIKQRIDWTLSQAPLVNAPEGK